MEDIKDIFENEERIDLKDLPKEIEVAINKDYGEDEDDYDYNDNEDEDYGRKFFQKEVKPSEIICLAETYYDMRGSGDTYLLEDHLINLEILSATRFNSVILYICKKNDMSKPAYAIYQLDDEQFHILKYL